MKLEIEEVKISKPNVGDVITVNGCPYLLMRNMFGEEDSYSALGFDGGTCSNGKHDSIDDLIINLKLHGHVVKHFSRDEFKLKLVKR